MMHAMHVGRDDEQGAKTRSSHAGSAILAWLNMAQALRITSNRNTASGEAPSGTHHHDLPQHRQRDLDRVKAHRRGHVDVAVGVMHLMQAPEQRHLVRDEMLRPDGEVEREQRDHDLEPIRPSELVQQPDAVRLRDKPPRRRPRPARRAWPSAAAARSSVTLMPRLVSQRRPLEATERRFGAASSISAMTTNTKANTARRITPSLWPRRPSMAGMLAWGRREVSCSAVPRVRAR